VSNAISVREASDLAQGLTADNIEAAVNAIPDDLVPVYLARLLDAATNIATLRKGLETRLLLEGKTGAHFEVGGVEYGFYGSQQKGWRELRTMLVNVHSFGVSLEAIFDAISEIRVTDLRAAAALIGNAEHQAAAMEAIEEARYDKGERGAPRFQVLDEKYVKALAAKK